MACICIARAMSPAPVISTRSWHRSVTTIIRNFGYTGAKTVSRRPASRRPRQEPGHPPETVSDGVRWLFAFNLPCYGAGLQIAPEADGSDGLLDVCTFRHGGLWHGLYYTAAVLTGTHHWLTDFARRRAGRLRVTSDSKVPYQLDGDPGGFLPVEIEVLPKRLTLVVPKEKAAN